MNTTREFLSITLKGATMVAATGFLPKAASASDAADMTGSTGIAQTSGSNGKGHYKPPFKFGMGGVPLGNEFEIVTDEDAYATIEAAWNAGVRYYDMAPWYGLGLAERRYGNFLHNKNRSEYVLSTKVGKLLKASKTAKNKEYFPFSPSPNDVSAITRHPVFGDLSKIVSRGLVSTASTSPLCMTSPPITSICQLPGRSSSKLREKAPFPN